MIGVSGMRGVIGTTMTPNVVTQMASAFAVYLARTQKPVNGEFFRVVIGRDSRPSGSWVRDCAAGALIASGIEVTDLDVVTTPGVAMMVNYIRADAGIIVTASHNPVQWNGLKFLNHSGMAFPAVEAEALKDLYLQHSISFVPVQNLRPPVRNTETHALHIKRVLEHIDVLGVSSKRFKVVLDSVNGAGGVVTATLLSKLGCQVAHLNARPDGQFAHEPEPTEANLVDLAAEVRRQKADVGFAQDPDADRLAIVDENGVYIGEEYSLVLAARHLLSKRPGTAVTNLSSSRMLDDVAQRYGSQVLRTAVGEANVVQTIVSQQAVIGGEGNGGVIDPRIVRGRDSLVGMAYVLQLMSDTGLKISQLVAEMPRYQIVKSKFECRREDANRAVDAIKAAFSERENEVRIDVQDGIRIDWPNTWVHARPSNTEPIMRIIAEAPTRQVAEERIGEVRTIVDKALA